VSKRAGESSGAREKPSEVVMGTLQQTIECLNVPFSRQQTSAFATIGVDLLPPPVDSTPAAAAAAATTRVLAEARRADRRQAGEEHIRSDSAAEGPGRGKAEALHAFLRRSLLRPEYLTGDNQLHVPTNCPSPGENPVYSFQDAKKFDQLAAPLPSALYLHLHRFAYDVRAGQLRKVGFYLTHCLVLHHQHVATHT
jgi:hypothetical protein